MSGTEDEAITVSPIGCGCIEIHDPRIQHVGERGECHSRALMSRPGSVGGVHGQAGDRRHGLLFDAVSSHGAHLISN